MQQPKHNECSRNRNCRGQASFETALALLFIMVPVTLALVGFAEVTWTYHALATLTRQAAHYAATHCWQDNAGSNVVTWIQNNAPAFPDRPLLQGGDVQIAVSYWTHDLETHQSVPFECSGGCSPDCVPDSVTVSVNGYQFNHFFPLLGMEPLQVPPFSTTVEMQGAGGDPETGTSAP